MAFVDSELQIATDLAVQAITLCSNIIQTAIREQSLISADSSGNNIWDTPVHETSPASPYYTRSYHPHSRGHQHHYHHHNNNNNNNNLTPAPAPAPAPAIPSHRHYNNSSSSISNDNTVSNPRASQRHSYYRQSNLPTSTSENNNTNSGSNCNSNSNSTLTHQRNHQQHKVPHPPPLSPFPLSSPHNSQLQSQSYSHSQSHSQSQLGQVDNDELCSNDETHTEHPLCNDEHHADDVTMAFVDEHEEMWCSQIAYSCEEAMINVLQSNTPLYNIVNVSNLYEEWVAHAHNPSSWQRSIPFSNSISTTNNNNPTWVIVPVYSPRSCWRRDPYTCTSIALLMHDKIILSLISVPCLNEMYSAVHGRGAFCNGQRMHVSNVCNLHGAVVFLPEPYKNAKVSVCRVGNGGCGGGGGDNEANKIKNKILDVNVNAHIDSNKPVLSEQPLEETENVQNKEEQQCKNKNISSSNSPTLPVVIIRKNEEKPEEMNENKQLSDEHQKEHEEKYQYDNNEEGNLFACLKVQVALSKIPVHSLRQINNPLVSCAFVAAGRAEVFFDSHISRFACAAGELLITEAGGVIINSGIGEIHHHYCSDDTANEDNRNAPQIKSYRSLRGICVCNNSHVAEEVQTILRENKYSM